MKATYRRHVGSDLDVVNNARVSFAKESEWEKVWYGAYAGDEDGWTENRLSIADTRLIGYLARGCTLADWKEMIEELTAQGEEERIIEIVNHVRSMPTHWTPFANGIGVTFHIKAPIPIMRQVFKHKIGTVENEVSRRYVDEKPEFFRPKWRKRAYSVKQGSGPEFTDEDNLLFLIEDYYDEFLEKAQEFYEWLLQKGVCPEQARFVLPQAMYSEAIVSNSLYGWARFYRQRGDSHAQKEIRDLAEQIGEVCEDLYPVSWKALTS